MKNTSHHLVTSTLTTIAAALLASSGAHAGISGINNIPSRAGILFDDTTSASGFGSGGTYTPGLTTPWTGALYSTPLYSDATTLDQGEGQIAATFTAVSYALNVPLAMVNHAIGNTGYVSLRMTAKVEVQIDAFGFSSPVFFSPFLVNGNVLPLGYAYFTGNISYTSAALGVVDNVTYAYQTNTVGAFSVVLPGVVSSGGAIHNLPANDTLTLQADFTLRADPATVSASTVPEPSAGLLTLLSLPLLLRRRRQA